MKLLLVRRNSHHHEGFSDFVDMGQGDGEGQGSLACCSSWGRRESDTT